MKALCIYHSRDLDGWMSAAIVRRWFEKENPNTHSIEDYSKTEFPDTSGEVSKIPTLHLLGWDYGDDIPKISHYDKVVMCDVSFPQDIMLELFERMHDNFILIDHHKTAIDSVLHIENNIPESLSTVAGLRDTKFAACELTWKYLFPDDAMPELVRLLGRYACFGHKGTDEEQKVLEFQYGARMYMENMLECYNFLCQVTELKVKDDVYFNDEMVCRSIIDKGNTVYDFLCIEAKQTYSKAFPVFF